MDTSPLITRQQYLLQHRQTHRLDRPPPPTKKQNTNQTNNKLLPFTTPINSHRPNVSDVDGSAAASVVSCTAFVDDEQIASFQVVEHAFDEAKFAGADEKIAGHRRHGLGIDR